MTTLEILQLVTTYLKNRLPSQPTLEELEVVAMAEKEIEKYRSVPRVWCVNDPTRKCVDCELCQNVSNPMTVEKLIKILRRMPDDYTVMIGMYDPRFCEKHPVEKVEVIDDRKVELSWSY